jgi:hypothetical protein
MNNDGILEYKRELSIQGTPVTLFLQDHWNGIEVRMSIQFPSFAANISVYAGNTQVHSPADALKIMNAVTESHLAKRVKAAKKEFEEPLRDVSEDMGDYLLYAPCQTPLEGTAQRQQDVMTA